MQVLSTKCIIFIKICYGNHVNKINKLYFDNFFERVSGRV